MAGAKPDRQGQPETLPCLLDTLISWRTRAVACPAESRSISRAIEKAALPLICPSIKKPMTTPSASRKIGEPLAAGPVTRSRRILSGFSTSNGDTAAMIPVWTNGPTRSSLPALVGAMRVAAQANPLPGDRLVILGCKFHRQHLDGLPQPKDSYVNASVGVDDVKQPYGGRPRVTRGMVGVEKLHRTGIRPRAAFTALPFQLVDYVSARLHYCRLDQKSSALD